MLYFSHMNLTRTYWPEWKKTLKNNGFSDFAAVLLEALAPFGFLISQFIYLTGWIFPAGRASSSMNNAVTFLEDACEIRNFAQYLQESENDLS
jgi:hypothetical protein